MRTINVSRDSIQLAATASRCGSQVSLRGFTVIELLVAVSVMSVIVYGLFTMFSQTQRALHGNIAQMDILESGRTAMGFMRREIEGLSAVPVGVYNQTNFFVETAASQAARQQLLAEGSFRTNEFNDFFLLNRINNQWTGIGYHLQATNGVGTLYRYQTNAVTDELARANMSVMFRAARSRASLLQAIAEGVVHLRVQAVNSDGLTLSPLAVKRYVRSELYGVGTELGEPAVWLWTGLPPGVTNLLVKPPATVVLRETASGQTESRFIGPALPAWVDVELGILDPKIFGKFRALSVNPTLATNFLAKQAASVHLFRQRIPIRTAPR